MKTTNSKIKFLNITDKKWHIFADLTDFLVYFVINETPWAWNHAWNYTNFEKYGYYMHLEQRAKFKFLEPLNWRGITFVSNSRYTLKWAYGWHPNATKQIRVMTQANWFN